MMKRRLLLLLPAVILLCAAGAASAQTTAADYGAAKRCYEQVRSDPQANAEAWQRCIDRFKAVARANPKSREGGKALYSAARLSRERSERFHDKGDVTAAIGLYNRVIREYPESALADDALYQIALLRHDPLGDDERAKRALAHLIEHHPNGDMAPKARVMLERLEAAAPTKRKEAVAAKGAAKPASATVTKEPPSAPPPAVEEGAAPAASNQPFAAPEAGPFDEAQLEAVRVQRGANATTVRLQLSSSVPYSTKFTELGMRTRSPPKLDLYLSYAEPLKTLEREYAVDSPSLQQVKVSKRWFSSGVKATFLLQPGAQYDIAQQGDDLVVTFTGRGGGAAPAAAPATAPAPEPVAPAAPKASRKKHRGTMTIVIDPGHGGKDPGAIGPKGTKEKDVTLTVGKELAQRLRRVPGVKVVMTRTSDRMLTLEDRNAIAVKQKADLFLSIHVNASRKRSSRGIETYYLNNATDEAAARLARRENRAARRNLSEVEHILSTMLLNHDAAESADLAKGVQRAMVARLSSRYPKVVDRGVRSALFYVLVGAKCPAVLLEVSFVSNPVEERRLARDHYRDHIAIGIAEGVGRYLDTRDTRRASL